jgi:hypothetical protein
MDRKMTKILLSKARKILNGEWRYFTSEVHINERSYPFGLYQDAVAFYFYAGYSLSDNNRIKQCHLSLENLANGGNYVDDQARIKYKPFEQLLQSFQNSSEDEEFPCVKCSLTTTAQIEIVNLAIPINPLAGRGEKVRYRRVSSLISPVTFEELIRFHNELMRLKK